MIDDDWMSDAALYPDRKSVALVRKSEFDALLAENERLRVALLPFASIQSQMGDYVGYPDNIIVRIEASVGELRRARAALKEPRT